MDMGYGIIRTLRAWIIEREKKQGVGWHCTAFDGHEGMHDEYL